MDFFSGTLLTVVRDFSSLFLVWIPVKMDSQQERGTISDSGTTMALGVVQGDHAKEVRNIPKPN